MPPPLVRFPLRATVLLPLLVLFVHTAGTSAPTKPPRVTSSKDSASTDAQASSDPSVMQILAGVREFRETVLEHFSKTADALEKTNGVDFPQAKVVRKFSENWLSLFGWNTGVMGLSKDFVMTYFGRSFFHNQNGPLIDAVRHAAFAIGSPDRAEKFPSALRALVQDGSKIFSEDGPLKKVFEDLKAISQEKAILRVFLGEDPNLGESYTKKRKGGSKKSKKAEKASSSRSSGDLTIGGLKEEGTDAPGAEKPIFAEEGADTGMRARFAAIKKALTFLVTDLNSKEEMELEAMDDENATEMGADEL